jgi:hypothetical protein
MRRVGQGKFRLLNLDRAWKTTKLTFWLQFDPVTLDAGATWEGVLTLKPESL